MVKIYVKITLIIYCMSYMHGKNTSKCDKFIFHHHKHPILTDFIYFEDIDTKIWGAVIEISRGV